MLHFKSLTFPFCFNPNRRICKCLSFCRKNLKEPFNETVGVYDKTNSDISPNMRPGTAFNFDKLTQLVQHCVLGVMGLLAIGRVAELRGPSEDLLHECEPWSRPYSQCKHVRAKSQGVLLDHELHVKYTTNIGTGNGQMVQMDPSKSGLVGSQVELRCIFINSNPPVKISQVTWQKLLNGTKQNVAIANPALGVSVLSPFKERVSFKQAAVRHRTPSLEDTTIVFSNLQLSDEAAYICEYTTFPAGNRENMVNLTVFARPMTRMFLTTPTIVARAQKRKMTVATCMSANGKPPSVIKWDTRLKGEATFQETRNPNGTVTVRSNYVVVPSRETHKQKLTCIVTYRSERITDSVVLNVQYEPDVKIEGFDGNWYLNRQNVQLTCRADANPPVTIYQWKLLNGSLPSNVEIKNNTLFFKGPVTYDLAGTYVCDATNGIGTRTGIVDVNIT
ncbi:hypothetical protein F2P81_016873, partial [Scophthalmus maximus]